MADFLLRALNSGIHFPPAHAPSERPSMNTDMTTDITGRMTPKEAKAILIQTIWYNRPQNPETKKQKNSRPLR